MYNFFLFFLVFDYLMRLYTNTNYFVYDNMIYSLKAKTNLLFILVICFIICGNGLLHYNDKLNYLQKSLGKNLNNS